MGSRALYELSYNKLIHFFLFTTEHCLSFPGENDDQFLALLLHDTESHAQCKSVLYMESPVLYIMLHR